MKDGSYINKVLSYIETSDSGFFKNNPTTRRKLDLSTYQIAVATRILIKKGIFVKYGAGCYQIDRKKLRNGDAKK